jgi:hypothetical protein
MKHRRLATLLVTSLAVGGLLTISSPAQAAFHEMKVREVHAGTASEPNADFVELQMWSPGQNFVGNHILKLYTADGSVEDCTIPSDVSMGTDQSRILFATVASGLDADFTFPPLLDGTAGAVCFQNIDCVSWGTFSGSTTVPAGTPVAGGIPDAQSIDRRTDIFGEPTDLDNLDDTNNSNNDFQAESPSPINNGDDAGPETMNCEPGGVDVTVQNLRTRVRANRATISGVIQPPAPGDTAKLTFFAKVSRFRKVATTFDQLDLDSRFMKRFRVPSRATRCRAVVAFHGMVEATKRFAC